MDYFILNKHSLPITRNIEDRCLKQFFDVYDAAKKFNFKQILIPNDLDPHWYHIEISKGRTILTWVNEQPRDYARKVKSLIQSLELREFTSKDIKGPHVSKFYYNDISVPFIGATYLLEQLAFSFNSDEIWNKPYFSLICDELDKDDIIVGNVATKEHWHLHLAHILEERKIEAICSDDIEMCIKKHFPHIIFINSASKELKKEHSNIFLREIWDACKELNEAIEKSNGQVSYQYVIDNTNLDISDESSSVKSNNKFSRERMKTYNGKRHFFGYHIKNFSGYKRVHFIIDNDYIVIGYLGKHLRLP